MADTSDRPMLSDWRDSNDDLLGETHRARYLGDRAEPWICEYSFSPGFGWGWIVWDEAGENILADDIAATPEDAERDCDAAALRWYALPPSLSVVRG